MLSIREALALSESKPDSIELETLKIKKQEELLPIPVEQKPQHYLSALANKPRDYVLYSTLDTLQKNKRSDAKKNRPISILCFGCHGTVDQKANIVAERIAEVAKTDQVLFIVVTGDNFYPKGVSKPNDLKFQKYFYDKYLKHSELKSRVFFLVLGNHDYNYRNFNQLNQKSGFDDVAQNEVIHSFLNKKGEFDPNKEVYLNNHEIDLETLKKGDYHWMMPSRFYKIYYPECNTQFFFLDSNTYLHDYLELDQINTLIDSIQTNIESYQKKINQLKESIELTEVARAEKIKLFEAKYNNNQHQLTILKKERKLNQAYWFKQSIYQNPGARNIVIQHHPLDSMGKRATASDEKHYINDAESSTLKEILKVEKGCDFLLMPSLPKALHSIPGKAKNAFIITDNEQLFYIDKMKDEYIEIPMDIAKRKQLQQLLELNQNPQNNIENSIWLYETLTADKMAALATIIGREVDQSRVANYTDMLKMAFRQAGILPKIDVLIHSHDHASSLYYSAKYNERGEMIKKGYCQLTVGGGGGEFQDMEEFDEIRKIPVYSGYGCSTITFKDDELIFNIYNATSPDIKDWHSRGKSWSFTNKNLMPRFNWDPTLNQDEKEFYLSVRNVILNGCYDYFDSYEQYKHVSHNKFFRSLKGRFGFYGTEGVSRGLNIIGTLNNPKPTSTLALIEEVKTLLEGSTTLFDKINQKFKDVTFKLRNNQFTANSLADFEIKYKAISLKKCLPMADLMTVKKTFVTPQATDDKNISTSFYQKTF